MGDANITELRKFAWVMAGAFGVLGGLSVFRGKHGLATVSLPVAVLFLVFGVLAPSALRPVHRWWMGFAHILARFNTTIILGMFFYLILTPVGVIMKVLRWDPLSRKLDRAYPTYWHKRANMKSAKDSYEHLY